MKNILSADQCRVLAQNMKSADYALFVSLVLCGAQARTWTWEYFLTHALDLPTAVYEAMRGLAISRGLALLPAPQARFGGAHWVNVNLNHPIFKATKSRFCVNGSALTTQDVTRRFKRYARLAGLDESKLNLRTVLNTHGWFQQNYGSMDKAAAAIGFRKQEAGPRSAQEAQVVAWTKSGRDARLHGIGRRSRA